MNQKTDERHNCPFCGNLSYYLEIRRNPKWDDYNVYCDICHCLGPSASTPKAAWEKWEAGINKMKEMANGSQN